jgi:O-antigen/teichoic acid export membrane protein
MHFSSASSVLVAYGVLVGLILLSVARSATRGAQQFRRYGLALFGECAARLGVGAALLAVWPHPSTALAAYMVAHGLTFAWTMRDLRALSPTTAPVPRSDVVGLLGATTALVVAMGVFQNVDMLLVKRYFTPADAGSYAAAVSFARWMALLALPFEALLLPQLTYLGERGHSVTAAATRLAAALVALAAIPLALFATVPDTIVTLVYGAEYRASSPLLLALGVGVFVQYVCYLAVQVLIVRGQSRPLYGFVVMGLVEMTLLAARHDSLWTVVTIIAGVRTAGATAIGTVAWLGARRAVPLAEHI